MDESKSYPSREERLREVMDKLEDGIAAVFNSEDYPAYLNVMSKFHRYSFGNSMLIALQCPGATQVAGFYTWKKEFGRNVKCGETGIRILAPRPYQKLIEREKIDPATNRPVVDAQGKTVRESVYQDCRTFKVVTVFDVSQTEGKELPQLGVDELTGTVAEYEALSAAVESLSPVPIRYEAPASPNAKGSYSYAEQCICVRPGMSQVQTLKTLIHEISHAKLHSGMADSMLLTDAAPEKDRHTREVEAESIAYVVCQRFQIDTSDYSFGYVAGWSKNRKMEELKSSLSCIRDTAAELIDGIERACPQWFPEHSKPQEQSKGRVRRTKGGER